MIRFVYFDLDDTLLDHRRAERAALADCQAAFPGLGRHGAAHVSETYHAGNAPLWRDYGDGRVTKDFLKRERFAKLLAALEADEDPDAVSAHYLGRYGAHWAWMEGAEAAYRAIAARFPVGLLTNGFTEQQRGKLARFPALEQLARTVVISEEVGAMKPQPAIFRHATEAAGVAPDEILYVGDSLHSDVRGGLAFGWHIAWFGGDSHPERAAVPDAFAFSNWNALLQRLGLEPDPTRRR